MPSAIASMVGRVETEPPTGIAAARPCEVSTRSGLSSRIFLTAALPQARQSLQSLPPVVTIVSVKGQADLVIVTTFQPSRLPRSLRAVSHWTILESPTIATTLFDDVSPNSQSLGSATPSRTWQSGSSV